MRFLEFRLYERLFWNWIFWSYSLDIMCLMSIYWSCSDLKAVHTGNPQVTSKQLFISSDITPNIIIFTGLTNKNVTLLLGTTKSVKMTPYLKYHPKSYSLQKKDNLTYIFLCFDPIYNKIITVIKLLTVWLIFSI